MRRTLAEHHSLTENVYEFSARADSQTNPQPFLIHLVMHNSDGSLLKRTAK